jgi:UDP-N-acetylmuramate dehydrogenase
MGVFDEYQAIVRADEPLAPLTWFRLGGPARYLARPRDLDQLVGLVTRARQEGLPLHLLGGGSNVLVADAGVPGLVVHLESPAFADVVVRDQTVEAGAAVPLTALISQTARAGLSGLEVLTGIPGTVGGSLRGNSGARHGSIGRFVRSVSVLAPKGEVVVLDRDELDFDARGSNLVDPVILSAVFVLEPDDPEAVGRRMRRTWIVKKEKQPYSYQSSGMIFRDPSPDLPAEALIEQAGLKGARVGEAEVSERHANFLIAHPEATADDVLRLIEHVRQKVWQQFGQELELQIQVWNASA